jgi:hypothetical protein
MIQSRMHTQVPYSPGTPKRIGQSTSTGIFQCISRQTNADLDVKKVAAARDRRGAERENALNRIANRRSYPRKLACLGRSRKIERITFYAAARSVSGTSASTT